MKRIFDMNESELDDLAYKCEKENSFVPVSSASADKYVAILHATMTICATGKTIADVSANANNAGFWNQAPGSTAPYFITPIESSAFWTRSCNSLIRVGNSAFTAQQSEALL